MIKAPENVRIENGLLKWDEVKGADGYAIHLNGEYDATVYDNEFEIDWEGVWSVFAFTNDTDEDIYSELVDAEYQ